MGRNMVVAFDQLQSRSILWCASLHVGFARPHVVAPMANNSVSLARDPGGRWGGKPRLVIHYSHQLIGCCGEPVQLINQCPKPAAQGPSEEEPNFADMLLQ